MCLLILDRFVTKEKQLPKIFGWKTPELDVEKVKEACKWLNDSFEGQRWPTVQECFKMIVLGLNSKYFVRRKLCGFRPLLRSEFFTSDNLGNSVLNDEKQKEKESGKKSHYLLYY